MKSSKPVKKEEWKIEIKGKFILLVLLAAIINYAAYYLKFPNSYGVVLGILFLILLFRNFKKLSGIEVVIYLFILNALTLPLTVFTLGANLASKIIIFVFNIALINFVVSGLRSMKKWGFYLTLVSSVISIVMLFRNLLAYIPLLSKITLPLVVSSANTLVSFALLVCIFVYIIRAKRYFK